MRNLLFPAVLALASFAAAQNNCGTLAVTTGTSVDVALTGATANAFAIVLVGQNTGSTTIRLGTSSILVGLAQPFFPVPLGSTDANGDASLSIPLPATIPQQINLNAQAVTLSFSLRPFGISGCTSNVVPFTIG